MTKKIKSKVISVVELGKLKPSFTKRLWIVYAAVPINREVKIVLKISMRIFEVGFEGVSY